MVRQLPEKQLWKKMQMLQSRMITVLNKDCMEVMSEYPDKYFDLAIVDPPYGANDKWISGGGGNALRGKIEGWDIAPLKEYWDELFRVSKDQIVWGANYFTNYLPISSRWICFEKFGLPKCPQFELAWTSLNIANKIFKADRRDININWGKWIHPTQKPIELYKWLLKYYAKSEYKIIDTHGGSMSSVIACYDYGINEMVCCEIDKEYYDAAVKRFEIHKMQQKLF